MIRWFPQGLLLSALCVGTDFSSAQDAPRPAAEIGKPTPSTKAEAMVMLDYQVIPVPGAKSIDLMGFHLLNKMNDWLYLGVGGYAPLVKGEYGGFMAVDATAHVQRRISGNLFANAGLSLGGGGGGKSVEQSRELSGTGGFGKAYLGLGYEFQEFSLGANIAKMKFRNSTIDHSQLNVFVQVPFSYAIGSYADAGSQKPVGQGDSTDSSENMLTLGLDNYKQISPQGSNRNTINVADLQFSHFMTKNSYWYFNVGVGYHGLPLYNQVLGGVGYRLPISTNVNLYGQLAAGSGGYAPETIDTGPGLLVYPKLAAEYKFTKDLGLSLSAGYLFAPKGSSKNYTVGASLNYHLYSGDASSGGNSTVERYRGYRFHVFQQTEFNTSFKDVDRSNINLLSLQVDSIVNDHVYIPIQVSVAYNAYLGYPGYGELLAGVGVQSRYRSDSRLQLFGQLLVGTNVHGGIAKTGLGLNYGLSDRLAIHGVVGQTLAIDKDKFKSDYVGVGVTYRFSSPSL